ncbi:MAG: endonuclease Q family protein, partial [bacterium]|nr:endonuclease Q family protein [bacterium]
MTVVADLHLHSRFSRAVSQQMNIPNMSIWAKKKGITLLATTDWTHPVWLSELKGSLEEDGSGLLRHKGETADDATRFLLASEISSIYSAGGRVRRIHTIMVAPSFAVVEKVNAHLVKLGVNLSSDGRPIMGLSSRDLLALLLDVDPRNYLIPAHVWTPWFSLYGSNSGFDSIDECFGDLSKEIFAIETGLSSDPAMNWRIAELDTRSIVSFSDAHSLEKMGRELTILESELTYDAIKSSLKEGNIRGTTEFFPEEGKYHWTGHRNCGVRQSPQETQS